MAKYIRVNSVVVQPFFGVFCIFLKGDFLKDRFWGHPYVLELVFVIIKGNCEGYGSQCRSQYLPYDKDEGMWKPYYGTIASMPSLLCRSQILIGGSSDSIFRTVVHTVRELQLWSKEIEWRHPSTKGSYCAPSTILWRQCDIQVEQQ